MFLPLLLFDCDGTLVDSEPLLAEEMAIGLNAVGLPFAVSDYMGEFRGARFRRIVAELQQRYGAVAPDQLEIMENAMRSNLALRLANELTTISGAREALQQLGDYPRAVVSNGPETKIRNALHTTALDVYFNGHLFSGYTANCWKPEPGLHLYAAHSMGFPAHDCIAIDDALVGVKAALDAGMTVIHLNRFPEEETTPPDAIMINSMQQLPDTIRQLTHDRWRHPTTFKCYKGA